MTFDDRIKTFPPILCRLLARENNEPLPSHEIVVRSGVRPFGHVVEGLSWRVDWKGYDLITSIAFMRGCGVDLTSNAAMFRHYDYLKKNPTFNYLRRHPDWRAVYQPMMIEWRKSYGIVTPKSPIWPPLRELLIRLNPLLQ